MLANLIITSLMFIISPPVLNLLATFCLAQYQKHCILLLATVQVLLQTLISNTSSLFSCQVLPLAFHFCLLFQCIFQNHFIWFCINQHLIFPLNQSKTLTWFSNFMLFLPSSMNITTWTKAVDTCAASTPHEIDPFCLPCSSLAFKLLSNLQTLAHLCFVHSPC